MNNEDAVFNNEYRPLVYNIQMQNPVLEDIHMSIDPKYDEIHKDSDGNDEDESTITIRYRGFGRRIDSNGFAKAMLTAHVDITPTNKCDGIRITASVSTRYARDKDSNISDDEFIEKVKKISPTLLFPYLRSYVSIMAMQAGFTITLPVIDTKKSIDNNNKVE